jgi:hypothetical protein
MKRHNQSPKVGEHELRISCSPSPDILIGVTHTTKTDTISVEPGSKFPNLNETPVTRPRVNTALQWTNRLPPEEA